MVNEICSTSEDWATWRVEPIHDQHLSTFTPPVSLHFITFELVVSVSHFLNCVHRRSIQVWATALTTALVTLCQVIWLTVCRYGGLFFPDWICLIQFKKRKHTWQNVSTHSSHVNAREPWVNVLFLYHRLIRYYQLSDSLHIFCYFSAT